LTQASPTFEGGRGPALPARLLALLVLGAWSIVVPYVGPAVGLRLDVRPTVEIVDHVVPGAVVLAAGMSLLLILRSATSRPSSLLVPALAGVAFLAGFWMLSTHVPLLVQSGRDLAPWGAAFHKTPGAAVTALSLWLLLLQLRGGEGQ